MAAWRWPNSTVCQVVDGDTVSSMLTKVSDLGFNVTSVTTYPMRLRLARINAARASTVRGRDATARVLAETAGKIVDITTFKAYKYGAPEGYTGEYVAEIVLPGGDNLSDLLVSEGHATYWNGAGPRPDDF